MRRGSRYNWYCYQSWWTGSGASGPFAVSAAAAPGNLQTKILLDVNTNPSSVTTGSPASMDMGQVAIRPGNIWFSKIRCARIQGYLQCGLLTTAATAGDYATWAMGIIRQQESLAAPGGINFDPLSANDIMRRWIWRREHFVFGQGILGGGSLIQAGAWSIPIDLRFRPAMILGPEDRVDWFCNGFAAGGNIGSYQLNIYPRLRFLMAPA